jgi:HEAT repeat protein
MNLRIAAIALILATNAFGSRPETIAEALKRHHVALTRSALVAALQNSDPEVRGLAAAQLAEEEATEAVSAIVKALDAEHVPLTKVNIAFALARLGNEKGVKTLESACHETETVAGVRMTAAMYMVNFLHKNTCLADVVGVLDSRNDDQSGNRMQALSLAPSFKGLSEGESQRLVAVTISNLQDTTASVRISASDALVRLGDASAVPYLQKAATVEQDDVVRNAMENALKRLQQRK